jgi:hypothetical protein
MRKCPLAQVAAAWLIIAPRWSGVKDPATDQVYRDMKDGTPVARWQKQIAQTFPSQDKCEKYLAHRIARAYNAETMVWCRGKDCAECVDDAAFKELRATGK